MKREILLTPGPVELHPRARLVLSGPQVHHRTEPAREAFLAVREGLKRAFGTEGEVLLLTTSGTGGMEAVAAGLFSPGDRVLVPVSGKFSERWAEIGEALGLSVERLSLPWGEVLDPEAIAARVTPDTRGLFLTHSETSTGVLNPVAEIAKAAREKNSELLVIVDAVTSLFLTPFGLDAMGLDAAVSGSQKGLMLPPGLAFVALGNRALSALKPRGYYLNLARELESQRAGEGAYTPAIQLVLAAREVLSVLLPELDAHHERKAQWNRALYAIGERLGLAPVPAKQGTPAPEAYRSPATAAFYLPEGVSHKALAGAFLSRGYRIAGGQGPLKGRIFRVSLMGHFTEADVRRILADVEAVLGEVFLNPAVHPKANRRSS